MSDHYTPEEMKQQDEEWQQYTGNEEFYVFQHRNQVTGHYYIEPRRGKNCHPDDGYGSANWYMKQLLSNRGDDHDWKKEILVKGITSWTACAIESRRLVNLNRKDPLLLTTKNIEQYFNEVWAYSSAGMLGSDYLDEYAIYTPTSIRSLSADDLLNLTIRTFQEGDLKSQFLLAKMLKRVYVEYKETQ